MGVIGRGAEDDLVADDEAADDMPESGGETGHYAAATFELDSVQCFGKHLRDRARLFVIHSFSSSFCSLGLSLLFFYLNGHSRR
jgi:hypothetical protein